MCSPTLGEVTSCKTGQPKGPRAGGTLTWFSGPNVGPQGLEGVGVGFPLGPGEDVGGGYQFHVRETGLLDSIQVLSFQESSADSSGPEVYICLGGIRDRFVHHDVGEIQTASRFQRPEYLIKCHVLVRTQVDDSVGNGYVDRGVRYR